MNTKEQENQLGIKIWAEIILTIIVWIAIMIYVEFGLWKSRQKVDQPLSIMNNVTTLNEKELDTLRDRIRPIFKKDFEIVNPEPFEEITLKKIPIN